MTCVSVTHNALDCQGAGLDPGEYCTACRHKYSYGKVDRERIRRNSKTTTNEEQLRLDLYNERGE